MEGAAPRPAREVRSDEILDRVGSLRRELVRRGEFLAPGWVDEAVEDLRTGRLTGWVLPESPGPAGIGFVSRRPRRAYGHVHIEPGAGGAEAAQRLASTLLASLPATVQRADIGLTGLGAEPEQALAAAVRDWPGVGLLTRSSLERPVRIGPQSPLPPLPGPLHHWPVRLVPLDALHALDWAAFQGTPDASLVADTPEENREMLRELLEGRLGMFLDAASTVLVDPEGRLVGAVLVAQQSTTRATVLDLMVDPVGRRRGIGTYLLLWAFRALEALGYDTVGLWVTESNVAARGLYERLGFRPAMTALILIWQRGR